MATLTVAPREKAAKAETVALRDLVRVPVRIDIVEVTTSTLTKIPSRRVAFAAPDEVTLIRGQRAAFYCPDSRTSVTVKFKMDSPFDQKEFVVPGGPNAVISGPVRDDAAFCSDCPSKPVPPPHEKGHYKYLIEDNKTGEILADPEVIIRN